MVGVSDGDTITVLAGTAQVKVRLNGIDCPERGQAFGAKARQLTAELAFGKRVTVRPSGHDRYGRVLGEVVLPDDKDFHDTLLELPGSLGDMAWQRHRR